MQSIEELRYLIKAADKEGEMQYARMLASLDITPSQNEVLKILSIKDGLSISEIGELLICGSDNPSRLVERLMHKELVEKKKNTFDSRVINIYITEMGKKMLTKTNIIETKFNNLIQETLENKISVENFIEVLRLQVKNTKTLSKIDQRNALI
ncbi:MarR family winged helix-turn-helix transcriptional regulator [Xylocopilactobacillus apis]|uniref:HTH marR-type domain-containing protein n=1 Tax=Xylocopilactobacillus apis TaxID=2932183 RepID=A0AAU9D2T7_9LACO|nr:MarR family transcriptional regulator [Xylocopilactobacillus apis]BDR55705.1 hypothetical protein KIMC2_02670 [Xylocopilactobacillus apis]